MYVWSLSSMDLKSFLKQFTFKWKRPKHETNYQQMLNKYSTWWKKWELCWFDKIKGKNLKPFIGKMKINNMGGLSSDSLNWLELAWQYIAMTRNNLSIIRISLCPIHVVIFTLISNLVTDYIQKRRGQALLFSFEYNLLPNLISK